MNTKNIVESSLLAITFLIIFKALANIFGSTLFLFFLLHLYKIDTIINNPKIQA